MDIRNSCFGAPINTSLSNVVCVSTLTLFALKIINYIPKSESRDHLPVARLVTATLAGGTGIFFILNFAHLSKKTKNISVVHLELSSCNLFRISIPRTQKQQFFSSDLVSMEEKVKESSSDLSNKLSQDLILKIFQYLSAKELVICRRVSRTWSQLGSDASVWDGLDLRNIFLSLSVFDESDWKRRNIDVTDVPPLDKYKVVPFLQECLVRAGEGNGITLLTIPKDLTMRKLMELPELPNIRKRLGIFFENADGSEDLPVKNTYQIVITNNFLKRSGVPMNEQLAILKKNGCEPTALEVAVLFVATWART